MIELRVLGALDLRYRRGRPIGSVPSQPKRLALLLYLALARPRGFHRRDTLLSLFWPELDDVRARRALRQCIYFLRQELGERVFLTRGEEIAVADDQLWCDAVALEDALVRNDAEQALALARGELLPGFSAVEAGGFEQWLEEERARLRARCAEAAWRAAEAAEAEGDAERALERGRIAAGFAAGDEVAMRRLFTLMERVGDRVGAVRAYDAFVARLAQEYDLEPSLETTQLIEQIRARRVAGGTVARAGQPRATTEVVPASPLPSPPPLRRRAGMRAASAPLALLAFTAVVLVLVEPTRRLLGASLAHDMRFVVTPFRASGADSAFWSASLPHLLSLTLDGMAGLQRSELPRPDASRGMLGRLRRLTTQPRFRIGGTIAAEAHSVVAIADVYDRARGARLGVVRVEVARSEPFTLVDRLTAAIVQHTGLLEAAAEIPRVNLASLTTQSQPALAAWLAGERHFRRSEFTPAYREFTRAVTLDSTFALAHMRRWLASAWGAGVPYTSPWPQAAARYVDRLPPRDARLVRAYTEPVGPSLHEVLERSVDEYPDDPELLFHLADRYYHERVQFQLPRARARGAFTRVLELDPSFVPAHSHLLEDAFATQDAAHVRRLLRALDRVEPQPDHVRGFHVAAALAWGDGATRARLLAALDTMPTQTLETAARALSYRSYATVLLPVAHALYAHNRPPDARREAAVRLMTAHFARGDVERALEVYRQNARLPGVAVELLRQHLIWRHAGVSLAPEPTQQAAALLAKQPWPSQRYLLAALAAEEQRWTEVDMHVRALEHSTGGAAHARPTPFVGAAASAGEAVRARTAHEHGDRAGALQFARRLAQTPGYWAVVDWAIEAWVIDGARFHLDAAHADAAARQLAALENLLVESPPVVLMRAQAEELAGRTREASRHYARLLELPATSPETLELQRRARASLELLSR